MATSELDLGRYKLGWSDAEDYVFKPKKGINAEIVNEMSEMKGEPDWMRQFRLRALKIFERKPMAPWFAVNMPDIDFNDIYYYIKPTAGQVDEWEQLPETMKLTYEKLGIPEAERKYLAGVTAQYESEVVYHKNRDDLAERGILFSDMDTALREYPEIVKKYFATIIPPGDNKFAALNSAVWSGGSFIYIPPGVNCEMPLQAYFRINSQNAGQFERTLIIADEAFTTSRAARRRCTRATRCTQPSWNSSRCPVRRSTTRRSRTGRRTCTTSSPSGRAPRPRPASSGPTGTSGPSSR
jgi:Fe-S cluster assembly protein SufB